MGDLRYNVIKSGGGWTGLRRKTGLTFCGMPIETDLSLPRGEVRLVSERGICVRIVYDHGAGWEIVPSDDGDRTG